MTALEQLLDTLDCATSPDDPPIWVQAFGEAGEGGVLTTDEDLGRLFGWVAPPPCWAVGVVAGGTAYPWPDDGSSGAVPTRRIRMGCLVGRDGEIVSRVHDADGTVIDDVPTDGRTLDALRRCLGLPTPPPERTSSELLSVLWLSEILAAGDLGIGVGSGVGSQPGQACRVRRAARASMAAMSWEEVALLHPAVRALVNHGHAVPFDRLDAVLRGAARAWSWSELRQLSTNDGWMAEIVPPDLARWMDDGMFSRWLLDAALPFAEVLAEVRESLAPAVGDELARCLAAAEVGPRPGCG